MEAISEQIHQQRQDALLRKQLGSRGTGVGAEQPSPPSTDSVSKEPFGIYAVTPAMFIEDITASPRRVRGKNWLSASSFEGGSNPNSREGSIVGSPRRSRPTSIEMTRPKRPAYSCELDIDSEDTVISCNVSDAASLDILTPASDLSHSGMHLSESIGGSVGGSATTSSIASPEESFCSSSVWLPIVN